MPATIAPSDSILSPDDVAGQRRMIMRGLDWSQYRAIADAFAGRHVRLSFDRGVFELMPISPEYAYLCNLLTQIVVVLTQATGMCRRGCRDMTIDREDLDRGFEPDDCFYLTNEPLVRGRMALDFTVDPPPDLGIEVDVTSDSRNRLPLYAAVRVPEVWRYKHETISFMRLQPDGTYRTVDRSGFFPFLGPADVAAVLRDRTTLDEVSLLRRFEEWVATQIVQPAVGQCTPVDNG